LAGENAMENEQNGFKKLSEFAGDSLEPSSISDNIVAGAKSMAEQASNRLKAAGIDTEDAIEMAEERAVDFQDMLMEEIRERPFRALGWAAAAGFVLGIMSAR
jgi:ElaB/YqjD/DUF883 family membrane-anchored ribosome-binding protein